MGGDKMMGQRPHLPMQILMLKNRSPLNMLLQFHCLGISRTGYNVSHFDNLLIHFSILFDQLTPQPPVSGPFLSTSIIALHHHRTIQLAM